MAISTLVKKVSMAAAEYGVTTLLPSTAQTVTFVTSRPDLGANDSVDWGVLGEEYTSVTSRFKITSANGLKLSVSCAGTFLRIDEGSGVHGNFAPEDKLLLSEFADGSVTIDFSTPIMGVGTQIQTALFGAFSGVIEAFDKNGTSLGSFSFSGDSDDAGDNSAIFVGLLSDTANIRKLKLYVLENSGLGFVINKLDIVTKSVMVPTPTLKLLVLGKTNIDSAFNRYQAYAYTAA